MHPGQRAAAVIAAALLLATAFPLAEAQTPAPDSRGVTLITGDRVLLRDGKPFVRPGAGRERIGYSVRRIGDRLHVTPADAVAGIAAGRLDRRLFDVTGLIEAGYDDRRADLPLLTDARSAALRTTADLPRLGLRAVSAAKPDLAAAWPDLAAAGRVWLDGRRTAVLDRSAGQIGAPQAWADGRTGAGVTVAVLDTGVDQTHPDLASREAAERNFTTDPDAVDRFGHGTHVASIVAGTGARHRGIAPGARILDGKVLDAGGGGQESWIIAGMEWAVAQGADIVNLSLGGTDTAEVDPLEAAINALSADSGALFVVAAGNSGPGAGSLTSPGTAESALTVGAVDRADAVASFSSRGPRKGDAGIKPDITAPGVGIAAAKASAGVIGEPVADGHVALSGTSMAAPHVAGAAALLAQARPDWPGARLKAALTASAAPASASVFAQGSGRVDVPAALRQVVTTAPTSVALGVQRWPHGDDAPVTRELTYRNDGPAEVVLDLAVTATGPDGAPAPAGMLAVSPGRLTVPAGGTATARVTANTRLGDRDGVFTGAVVASGTGVALRTPVAVDREVESYDLELRATGPDGTPAPAFDALVLNKAGGSPVFLSDPSGVARVRLPRGDYLLDTLVIGADRLFHIAQPVLAVTADTTASADARQTRPIRLAPADPASFDIVQASYSVFFPSGTGVTVVIGSTDPNALASQHAGAGVAGLSAMVGAQWSTSDSTYYLAAHRDDTAFTGLDRTVPRTEMATVRSRVAASGEGRTGEEVVSARSDSAGMLFVSARRPLPAEFTAHHSVGSSWTGGLWEYEGDELVTDLSTPEQTLTAGQTYQRSLNWPVFAPAFGPVSRADRVGNEILLNVPFAGDGAGHAGWSAVTSGRTRLLRAGVEVGVSEEPGAGLFAVPAEAGEYRLEVVADRRSLFGTSTRIEAAWTFRSGESAPLPLDSIRLSPALTDGVGRRGEALTIPVALVRNGGAGPVPARSLTAEVSYDEGATWQPASTTASSITVAHPASAGSVSLRVRATGADGTAELTLVRAYRLV